MHQHSWIGHRFQEKMNYFVQYIENENLMYLLFSMFDGKIWQCYYYTWFHHKVAELRFKKKGGLEGGGGMRGMYRWKGMGKHSACFR